MAKILFLCVVLLVLGVHTKHIHPRSVIDNAGLELDAFAENGVSIDLIQNMKPSRFVPINNAVFFRNYPPCEDGFERDVLGICREVWD